MDDAINANSLAQGAILGAQMDPEAQAKWKAEQDKRDAKYEAERKAEMVLNKRSVALEAAIRLQVPGVVVDSSKITADADVYFAFLMKVE